MKRLLFQAVFLAMGMIMGVYASGDVGLDLMCARLWRCVVPRWGNTRRVRGLRWR